MKKLLFFKSSSSNGGENHEIPAMTGDKKRYVETRWKTVVSANIENKFQSPERFSPVSDRKAGDRKMITKRSSVLRRSRSLSTSSTANHNGKFGKEDPTELRNTRKFPSSRNDASGPLCDDCHFQLTGNESKLVRYERPNMHVPGEEILLDRGCSVPSYSTSPRSSSASTSIRGKVLDLYIDGEQRQETKLGIGDFRSNKNTGLLKGRSHSSSNLFYPSHDSSRDHLGSKIRHESPRKLAKDVVERLVRLEQVCDSKPRYKNFDGRSYLNVVSDNKMDSNKHSPVLRRDCRDLESREKDDTDSVLRRKLEETKERAKILSMELSQDNSLEYHTGNLPALTKKRSQLEEERKLVAEISDQLQCRIAGRASMKEEMNSLVLKSEREKNELQSCFQRELDRRADEFAFKLQELLSEKNRLRDRVRELAEQNVSLQKEVSCCYTKEQEYSDRLSQMEADIEDATAKMDQARSENEDLLKKLSEIQDKLKVSEDSGSCLERSCKEKERENAALIKSVARLQGTCSQQERTIEGLRQSLILETEKHHTPDKQGNLTLNLQMEQLRLTEVEQELRRQLETCRIEAESLRSENMYLFERLKGIGNSSALKLDQELESHIQCLNETGLSLLNKSTQMCQKLLEILKTKENDGFLEAHSLAEYDMKIQGFKQGSQQLETSLSKASSVLKEKGEQENDDPGLSDVGSGRFQNTNRKVLEDDLKSELKAECLVTSILKEKLYSKEKEIEQLQTELARALRNHDLLKSEIQDAFDTISCVNHKMKTLELQMIKKDGTISQLEREVWSKGEELSKVKGVLSKVTQERDLMWEEVKQYSEKNMLLNSEMNSLKKKIEALEEETLLKDGQISILKDSLNNAQPCPFGLDHRETFRL